MFNLKSISYTWNHKKAFLKVEKQLIGKNTISGYLHDVDKLILYLLPLNKKTIRNIHRKYSRHHVESKREKNYLEIIEKNTQELNNRRYNKYWNNRYNTTFPIKLSNNLNLVFEYEKDNNESRMIKTITIQNSYDRKIIEPVNCDSYDGRNRRYLNEDDLNNNEKFINAYISSFKEVAKRFNALEIN